ncbi:MAG: hypothetical protein P1U36_06055 [Legionellaceae bacterium]|nr:hypothetical protein [Legionellaceae bacterium]
MPVLSKTDVFNKYLKKSEAEAIAFLESDITSKQQKLHDDFWATASQIERNRDVSMQENQTRRDTSLAKIKQNLSASSSKTWAEYQAAEAKCTVDEKAAELLYAQTFFAIHNEHTQKKKENEQTYEKSMAKMERRFHAKLRDVSHQYAPVYQLRNAQMNNARKPYSDALNTAWRIFDSSERQARALTIQASQQAHAEAVKERDATRERLQVGSRELLKTSYEMVAARIGLDGITPNITTYMSTKTPYDSIQPLVGYMDLRFALYEATKNPDESELKREFYDISGYAPDVDVASLKEAVHSLDLAALSQIFKHRCLFMRPPSSPEERTLYVDVLGEFEATFTVVSPYGEVLTKSYHIELKQEAEPLYTQEKTMRDYIVENAADFVRKLYSRSQAGSFDAFSELMESHHGFKAHVLKTIAASNRALKRPEGLNDIKLTKRHISASRDGAVCTFDETPFYHATEAFHAQTLAIDARYYARCKALEETCAEGIHEADLLKKDMYHRADVAYDLACNAVEHELEWDELAAELSVHRKAFYYYANPEDCAVLVDPNDPKDAEGDMVSYDADRSPDSAAAAEVLMPVKKSRGFKSKYKPHMLFSICEHSADRMDDTDREVCEIMGGK